MNCLEASLNIEKAKTEKILIIHDTDLVNAAALLKHYQEELNNFPKWQRDAQHHFFNLESKVNSLDMEVHMWDNCISSLEDAVAELCSLMGEMESCLCQCADKEGRRTLEEGEVREPSVKEDLEYTSNNSYQTPPVEVVQELHLIKDVLDCAGPSNSCSCSLEEPIILSDKEETVIENNVPIPIWVECSPAQDRVVCGQRAVHGHSGIHCTVSSVR